MVGDLAGAGMRLAGAAGTVLSALETVGAVEPLRARERLDRPVPRRERDPVALERMPPLPGHFPAEVTDAIGRLRGLDRADPARSRARDEIIEACLPTARRLAGRYRGSESPGDLVQVAALGLVKAVDGFDPGRGVDFGACDVT